MKIKSKVNVNVNKSEDLNGNIIRMYEAPSITDGEAMHIYACKGNSCNGKTHMVYISEIETVA